MTRPTRLPTGLQKRGDSYRVQYKHKGQWRQVSAGKVLGEALELHARLRGQEDGGGVRFGELVERFLKRHETYSKPTTLVGVRSDARRLVSFFRNREVASLTVDDLEAFVSDRSSTAGVHSVNRELRALRRMLRQGLQEGVIDALPFKVQELRTIKREVEIMDTGRVNKLLSIAEPRIKALIMLAASTGFRRQELLHLKWSDLRGEQLHISPKEGWSPKTYERRSVFLSAYVLDYLAEYRESLEHNSDDDWLFQSKRTPDGRLNDPSKALRTTFRRAGLYSKGNLLHVLRHSVATTLLNNGTPLHVAMSILGHANLQTTQGYLHGTEQAKRDASTRGIL